MRTVVGTMTVVMVVIMDVYYGFGEDWGNGDCGVGGEDGVGYYKANNKIIRL